MNEETHGVEPPSSTLTSLYHEIVGAFEASSPPEEEEEEDDPRDDIKIPSQAPPQQTGQLGSSPPDIYSTTVSRRRVEVNQRALIDKILARYATAGAVYRELMANSNDANATKVQIHFVTDETQQAVSQVVYRNNGMVFRNQDWERLQKIAEGNPDPEKVGAFGVGAYSMFSICEEPLVLSGNQALLFTWKNDALWTKQMMVPPDILKQLSSIIEEEQERVEWTSFVLPLRQKRPLTKATMLELGHFLCGALTFADSLNTVQVFVDGKETLSLHKRILDKETKLSLPPAINLYTDTSHGLLDLDVDSLTRHTVDLEVKLYEQVSIVTADHVSATARTNLDQSVATELQRITKKPPPDKVKLQLLRTATMPPKRPSTNNKPSNKAARIARNFVDGGSKGGKIFIGFKTSQTTGYSAHLCAPFLPTVEREALDLQHSAAAQFNFDLLECSGMLMRLFLEGAMHELGQAFFEERREALEMKQLADDILESDDDNSVSGASSATCQTELETQQSSTPSLDPWGSFTSAIGALAGISNEKEGSKTGQQVLPPRVGLKPNDTEQISDVERQAILLMKSYCPNESTPSSQVGTTLTTGFQNVMTKGSTPVLTCHGVVPAKKARLPFQGLEEFCSEYVVRSVVFQNTGDYHTQVAPCCFLEDDDLLKAVRATVFTECEVISFLKWYTGYIRNRPNTVPPTRSLTTIRNCLHYKSRIDKEREKIYYLKQFLFYTGDFGYFFSDAIPVPDGVLPRTLEDGIGPETLSQLSVTVGWFRPMSANQWVFFISKLDCFRNEKALEDPSDVRLGVLVSIGRYLMNLGNLDRKSFVKHCQATMGKVACVPYDLVHSNGTVVRNAGMCLPKQVIVSEEIGKTLLAGENYFLASQLLAENLRKNGVSIDLLVGAVSAQTEVSPDGLMQRLLRKSESGDFDAKQTVQYLMTVLSTSISIDAPPPNRHTISKKLTNLQLWYAENDKTRSYAPNELHFPCTELRLFPSIKILDWPADEALNHDSEEGRFLLQLGIKVDTSVKTLILDTADLKNEEQRTPCLDFIVGQLRENQNSQIEFKKNSETIKALKFLPCTLHSPLDLNKDAKTVIKSPADCYCSQLCGVMGFPVVLRPSYGVTFQCENEPPPKLVLQRFLSIVAKAKELLKQINTKQNQEFFTNHLLEEFSRIFEYMSSRAFEFDQHDLLPLRSKQVLPYKTEEQAIGWSTPGESKFSKGSSSKDPIAQRLFHTTEFTGLFLGAIGVTDEARAFDYYDMVLDSPKDVLDRLGGCDKLYCSLLRRLATMTVGWSHTKITQRHDKSDLRTTPFFIAYRRVQTNDGTEATTTYALAKASDICVIDNTFYGRLFDVARAPCESDLEDFYLSLGAKYISTSVRRTFKVKRRGPTTTSGEVSTAVTDSLWNELEKKIPLLVSPGITSRPLVSDAASRMGRDRLEIYQAESIVAFYTLAGKTVNDKTVIQQTTCSHKLLKNKKRALYVTENFDWFDVGRAISEIILKTCHVEDAFFVGALLDTSMERLRARGFAVDRVLMISPSDNSSTTTATTATTTKGNSSSAEKAETTQGRVLVETQKRDDSKCQEEKEEVEEEEQPQLFPPALTNLVSSATSTAQSAAAKVVSGSTSTSRSSSTSTSWFGSSVDMLKNIVEQPMSPNALAEPLLEPDERAILNQEEEEEEEETHPTPIVENLTSGWW